MNVLLIILFVAALGVAYCVYSTKKKNKNEKKKIEIKPEVKIDHAPVSNDVSITTVSKKGVITIDKTFLKFHDEDGDVITHVKYKIDKGSIYLDKKLTEVYKQWTELPIDAKVYIKSKDGDVHKITYSVKSNDKWSK